MEIIDEHAMTVTTKGQVTIPVEIRHLLGVKPHDKVIFQVAGGRVELRAADMTLEDTFGAVKPRKRPEDFQVLHDIAIEDHILKSSIE